MKRDTKIKSVRNFLKNYIILIIGTISILIFTYFFHNETFLTPIILAITAVIVLWYTHETSVIAKATAEQQSQFIKPTINYRIYTHQTDKIETMFKILNSSNYPVAVRLNLKVKINNEILENFSPAYDGTEYWNLQYRQKKVGHFSFLDLLLKKEQIPQNVYNNIKQNPPENRYDIAMDELSNIFNSNLPKIIMDIEIYCENEMDYSYYPPVHYDYVYERNSWIPKITSTKPYWEYDSIPDWINNRID